MIIVQIPSLEYRQTVLDRAAADGHCVVLSIAGAMIIERKDLAIEIFMSLASKLAAMLDSETLPIVGIADERGNLAIGMMPESPAGIVLYGVTDDEFKEYERESLITEH